MAAQQTLAEANLLPPEGSSQTQLRLSEVLFAEQLQFVEDPARNKIAVCSRRAGKTEACAYDLVYTAINNPEIVCLYITLRRNSAKRIIWKQLKRINRVHELGGVPNESELCITFPNQSTIYLSGAKDASEIETFRGMAIKLCYIDECQSFRDYIRDLIDDVISPALMDYAGTLCLIGTPGPLPVGFFAEVAGVVKGKEAASLNWSHHSWTFWNNPYILKKSKSTHQVMLDYEIKRRGVGVTDPSIQREWFGRWVNDSNSLLLHYSRELNHFDTLPTLPAHKSWNYIMGVDLGYEDADALVVIAWSPDSPVTYIVEEQVTNHQGITELSLQIDTFRKKYPISKIVMDEGALGKKIAEEIRRQKGIPVHAADKKLKMQNVAFLNDAMKTGRFKARHDSRYAQDTFLVEIDRDKTTPEKIVVSKKYHSDVIDAVLYAFKESPAFSYTPTVDKPKYGTPEWAIAEQERMFKEAQEHFAEIAELQRQYSG